MNFFLMQPVNFNTEIRVQKRDVLRIHADPGQQPLS
jgi:hypothetical protein